MERKLFKFQLNVWNVIQSENLIITNAAGLVSYFQCNRIFFVPHCHSFRNNEKQNKINKWNKQKWTKETESNRDGFDIQIKFNLTQWVSRAHTITLPWYTAKWIFKKYKPHFLFNTFDLILHEFNRIFPEFDWLFVLFRFVSFLFCFLLERFHRSFRWCHFFCWPILIF